MQTFDAAVIGLGAHGSGAALAFARRGLTVVGIEMGERAHERGSSGGRSRMIRRAYFEHPAYLPLLAAAWDGWTALGAERGGSLVEVTGGLYLGQADSDLVVGSTASARELGLPHEAVGAEEIRRRWPAFVPDDATVGLFDPGAGMIRPDRAIEAQLAAAERRGADLRFGERAVDWRPSGSGSGLEVETDRAVYSVGAVAIAAGAWTSYFVPDLGLPLEVERQSVLWFEPPAAATTALERLPVWIFDTTFDGAFYGFPYDPSLGLKVARHHSGEVLASADDVDRTEHTADVERIRAFSRRHMPVADGPVRGSMVCLYTNTPDLHFVIDTHPAVEGVAFASACSGHGFKFAPVVGEILADLSLTGSSDRPIELFRANRLVAS
jgi:sarcosine oxidase